MRRVADEGVPTLPIGIRSLSKPEAEFAMEAGIPIVWANELRLEPDSRAALRLPERST
jgi:agmatinase